MNTDNMEMPTPCQKCGNLFDLNDGTGSTKWFPNTIICESCGNEEEKEIERDEEIEELQNSLSDAEWTIKDCNKRLIELGAKPAGNERTAQEVERIASDAWDAGWKNGHSQGADIENFTSHPNKEEYLSSLRNAATAPSK